MSIVAEGSGLPGVWITDPALLRFEYYRDRCLWGKPNAQGVRSCLNRELASEPFPYTIHQKENHYPNGLDPNFGTWLKALESGRSYLAGSSTQMTEFIRRHSSRMIGWQRMAYEWCIANPSECLIVNSKKRSRIYEIKKRGEYVEIGLPHHTFGGERYWITRNGRTKVLVNVD